MLNYSQVWSSFPASAPRDDRCHFYSWKSILGTLGDLIMATGIVADVTRCSVDGGFQQHCGLSIFEHVSASAVAGILRHRVIFPENQGALPLPSVSSMMGQVIA